MQGIVDYTFHNVCEKNHHFLSSTKTMHTKQHLVHFFCLTVYIQHKNMIQTLWILLQIFLLNVISKTHDLTYTKQI